MRAYAIFCSVFAAFSSYLFGFDTGVITTTIAQESFKVYFDGPAPEIKGSIVAIYIAGEAVGALSTLLTADYLGRKRTIQVYGAVAVVGTILQTAAVHVGMLLAGRVITGAAVGALVLTAPIYLSEISPPTHRGLIVGLSGLGIAIGNAVSNWVGYGASFADNVPIKDFAWRFPLSMQIPPGLVLFFGSFFLPFSPRWLVTKGRYEEAEHSFRRLRAGEDEDVIDAEFNQMKEQILYEKSIEVKSFKKAFTDYKKRMWISIGIQTMTSLTGVNVINYYQTTLYEGVGITGQTTLLLASCYGLIGPIMNSIGIVLLDKWGRVQSMYIGTFLLALDLIFVSIMSKYFVDSDSKVGQGFIIAGIYMFTTLYYLMINSQTWLYGAEIVPVFLRGKAMALASASHFIVNVGINQAGPTAFGNIGWKYYWVFICCALVTSVLIFFFCPETKNKTLEEIAGDFGDRVVVSARPEDHDRQVYTLDSKEKV